MKTDNKLENSESVALLAATEISGDTADQISAAIAQPDWPNTERFNDWRNYIPEGIRAAWPNLSVESRVVAFTIAGELAQNELYNDVD